MYFVCKIFNNTLGSSNIVSGEKEGIEEIKKMAAEQFQRSLYDHEIFDAENKLEIYNDEDSDNVFTFSIGILEES